ncbi:CoA pyrophosphatase [Alteromonas sp. 1_MG-2023]|uniref:CoA pyrophosphatase n=1 Tax=Alteromonas sp. 1_MG-2023 TaxID=3062669 RepID=UPI0026E3D5DF|nr:CoA pyrophosphatase [Alteromonas sp. 1_MG-2023]MDO6477900.1 CoA pyrophosphatase [Alteromonas sp. 1_MG-2023]
MNRSEFLQRYHHLRQIDYEADYPLRKTGRAAGVLIPLIDHPDGLTVLLTERAHHLRHHPGQISFPGGGAEPQDNTLADTALREAEEEVGLLRSEVDIIGALPEYRTISGYAMTPVIGFVKPGPVLTIDRNEVADAFEVPLAFLMDRRNHFAHFIERKQQRYPVYFMPWQSRLIWGATAAILRNLSSHLCDD